MLLKRIFQIYSVKLLTIIELDAGLKQAKFEIKGMPCFVWAGLTRAALEGLEGIKKAELTTNSAVILFDDNLISITAIQSYLERFGLKGKFNLIINHLKHIFKSG